jgi:hypothetical protein
MVLFKKPISFFLASLVAVSFAFAQEPTVAPLSLPPATETLVSEAQKPLKVKKKKKRKKPKKMTRKPSSIESGRMAAVVFSETQNFESMVTQHETMARQIASQSQTARVIGVKRELGLTEYDSARAPQNIIINGGTQKGFEKGMTLKVTRKIPVIDQYMGNKQSELEIEFAQAKIIEVTETVAVARIQKIDSIDKGPYVGTRGILIGDFVR